MTNCRHTQIAIMPADGDNVKQQNDNALVLLEEVKVGYKRKQTVVSTAN